MLANCKSWPNLSKFTTLHTFRPNVTRAELPNCKVRFLQLCRTFLPTFLKVLLKDIVFLTLRLIFSVSLIDPALYLFMWKANDQLRKYMFQTPALLQLLLYYAWLDLSFEKFLGAFKLCLNKFMSSKKLLFKVLHLFSGFCDFLSKIFESFIDFVVLFLHKYMCPESLCCLSSFQLIDTL